MSTAEAPPQASVEPLTYYEAYKVLGEKKNELWDDWEVTESRGWRWRRPKADPRDTFGHVTLIQSWHLERRPSGAATSWAPVQSEDQPCTGPKGRGQGSSVCLKVTPSGLGQTSDRCVLLLTLS